LPAETTELLFARYGPRYRWLVAITVLLGTISAAIICALYRRRWQVELFFKWIKQHLRIKKFYGNSANAVKSKIWIVASFYALVAIVK
jgi:transposase